MATYEEVFEQDLEEATRKSLIDNHHVEGETSKTPVVATNEENDEELVDYGSTPEQPTTPYDLATEVLQKLEEEAADGREESVLDVLSQHLEGSEPPMQ